MNATKYIYDSIRLAEKYAYSRPPVHEHLIQYVKEHLQTLQKFERALDIGCGAGLSTAVLASLANLVVGIEPIHIMLSYRHIVAPHARFLVGQAEDLPFADETFELITAAGSINYADTKVLFSEIERVLTPEGNMIIYDFSPGRRFRDHAALEEWYEMFAQRYPAPPGYDMDVKAFPYADFGLSLDAFERLEVAIPMNLETYSAYALSEAGVEAAIARGVSEEEIQNWCHDTLSKVFTDTFQDVLFDSYIAIVKRQ